MEKILSLMYVSNWRIYLFTCTNTSEESVEAGKNWRLSSLDLGAPGTGATSMVHSSGSGLSLPTLALQGEKY